MVAVVPCFGWPPHSGDVLAHNVVVYLPWNLSQAILRFRRLLLVCLAKPISSFGRPSQDFVLVSPV